MVGAKSSIFGDPPAKTMMTVTARSLNFTHMCHMFEPFGEKFQTSKHGELSDKTIVKMANLRYPPTNKE
jgi:hypothetical protein